MPGDDLTPAQRRNLEALTAWVDAYNSLDGENLAKVVTENFRLVDPATGTDIVGPDSFDEIARQVALLYPDRRITVTQMIPLGDSAVAMQGAWDGTAATESLTARQGAAVHHVESMVVDLMDGKITLMRIYR